MEVEHRVYESVYLFWIHYGQPQISNTADTATGRTGKQFDRSALTAPIVDLLQAIPQIGLYKDVTKEEARVLIIKVKKIKPNENPTKTTQTKSCVIEFRQKQNSPIRKPTNWQKIDIVISDDFIV